MLDPAHRMLDQLRSVEQVSRGLPDRLACPAARRERRAREVPDVVLFAYEALVGKGAIGGIDVGEGPPDTLAPLQDRVTVGHAALIRNLRDGLSMVHEGNSIQWRAKHRDLATEVDQPGVGRVASVGVVVRVGGGDLPGKRPDGGHPGLGMPAVVRPRPRPEQLRDPPVVAACQRDPWIVDRLLLQIGAPLLFIQGIDVVGRRILPAGVGHQRPPGPRTSNRARTTTSAPPTTWPSALKRQCTITAPPAPTPSFPRASTSPERVTNMP